MSARHRVLVASRNSDVAWSLHREALRLGQWEMIGIIDPQIGDTFERTCAMADIVLLAAEDLLWLWDNRPGVAQEALATVRAVVVLTDRQMLDVVSRMQANFGLLLRAESRDISVDLLELAGRGYIALPESLLDRMIGNRLRLDIVEQLSSEERNILSHIGAALTNRRIAQVSGLAESRVKTVVHLVTHKLHLTNRTAVAVFATANGLTKTGQTGGSLHGKSAPLKIEVGPEQEG